MGLSDFKITDADITSKGVQASPDQLGGTAEENKKVFDRLTSGPVREGHNNLIDALIAAGVERAVLLPDNAGGFKYIRLNSDKVLEVSTDGSTWQATGSSGHLIYDKNGVQLPQRSRMRFSNSEVTDDGVYTIVNGIKGDTGPQGVQGIQGPEGPQGPRGYPANVNGVTPDNDGNITLSASRVGAVGYATPQSLTPAQQAQARDNINAPAPYEAGDNISITGSVIATKAFPCNPNLLDNWYFGNPVDQREGRIVPAGTPYFVAGSSTQTGVLSSPATVIGYLNSGGKYPQVKVGGETYITPIGTDISGYVGAGYTIDRWKLMDNGIVFVEDNSVHFVSNQAASYKRFVQLLEITKTSGKTFTLSALMKVNSVSGNAYLRLINKYSGDAVNRIVIKKPTAGYELFTFSKTLTTDFTNGLGVEILVSNKETDNIDVNIIAMKLEFGSQQTLAHQENGVWVLNEIPKFGDQLAECQRYFEWVDVQLTTSFNGSTPYKVVKRTTPVFNYYSVNGTVGKISQYNSINNAWDDVEPSAPPTDLNLRSLALCVPNQTTTRFRIAVSADL